MHLEVSNEIDNAFRIFSFEKKLDIFMTGNFDKAQMENF